MSINDLVNGYIINSATADASDTYGSLIEKLFNNIDNITKIRRIILGGTCYWLTKNSANSATFTCSDVYLQSSSPLNVIIFLSELGYENNNYHWIRYTSNGNYEDRTNNIVGAGVLIEAYY